MRSSAFLTALLPHIEINSNIIWGNFKYYFGDFVRKGGTPPPFTDKIFGKKGVTDLGGTPPSPFTDKIRKVVFEVLPML